MTALLLQYRAAQDTDFRNRVAVAFLTAAVDISTESGSTPNHAKRLVFAQSVIDNPESAARRYTPHVMTNASIATQAGANSNLSTALAAVPDNDIIFQVNSLIDTLAGA